MIRREDSSAASRRRKGKPLRALAPAGVIAVAIGIWLPSAATGLPPATLTLTPDVATNTAGEQHCVTATVRDVSDDPPDPAVPVIFSVSGANTSSGQQTTDSNGQASFCYTGTKAGLDTIDAFADTDGSSTKEAGEPGDSATNTYTPAAPAALSLSPATATTTAGQQHCVTATVEDAFQNRKPAVSVRFSVSGQNSASGSGITDTNGQTTFCYTGTKAGVDTISAFADTDGSTIKDPGEPDDSATNTYVAAAPAALSLSPATDTNTAGQQHCVTATVEDAFQNRTPAVSVRFSVSGQNSANGSGSTNASGQAAFCYTGTKAGADTISAFADTDGDTVQDVGEPGDVASKTYVAGNAATLALSPEHTINTVGVQQCVSALAKDAFQNLKPGVTVRFSVTGANTTSGQQTTDANGQASFCYTGTKSGTDTITAFADTDGNGTKNASEPGDSVTKAYVAGAPSTLALSPANANTSAGSQHCVTATVRDSFANVVRSVAVRFAVTGANTASGQQVTGAAGQARFCYVGTKAGVDSIAAFADTDSSGTKNGSEPGNTAGKTWRAAAPAALTLAPQAHSSTVGIEHCVTGTVRDEFGNPVPGVTIRFTVSGASTASGQDPTGAVGKATFCYTGTSAGTDTITAFADTDASGAQGLSEPGDTATNAWRAAAPATLTLAPATDTGRVGTVHCLTATARDEFGNAVRGVTIRFSTAGANIADGQQVSGTGGNSRFCYTGTKSGTDAVAAFADTDSNGAQNGSEPSGSATKIWTAAPPAALTLAPAADTNAAGLAHCLTATVRDDFANPVPDVTVRFSVAGMHTANGQDNTGPSGRATFCYTGTKVGDDAIAAFADTNANGVQNGVEPGDSATKTWRAAAPATLTLAPASATGAAGSSHCLLAVAEDAFGNPARGVSIRFAVTGANAASGQQTSGPAGGAGFCYTGTQAGSDTIRAFADTDSSGTQNGGEPADTATKTYVAAAPASLTVAPSTDQGPVGTPHCSTATVRDEFGNTAAGVRVRFSVTANNTASGERSTGASGRASFCYTGTKVGTDTITAYADSNASGTKNPGEPDDRATKIYVAGAPAELTLAPASASRTVGSARCTTATVRDAFGNPTADVSVRFSVTGANVRSGQQTTDGAGGASYCYTGTSAGTDTIAAFADADGSGARNGSEPAGEATQTYLAAEPAVLALTPESAAGSTGDQHCVTATVRDSFENANPDVTVRFTVRGVNDRAGPASTDQSGRASFCYTGANAGTDTISAFADTDANGSQNGVEPDDGATRIWRAFSPTRAISVPGQNASRAEVAVAPTGAVVFTWERFDGTSSTCCFRIEARARSAAGALGPVHTLSAAGQNASSPQVAVDAAGDAVIVWERLDGTSSTCCSLVEARGLSAAGSLGPLQHLSGPGQNASSPKVGVGGNGDAFVVWARFDPTRAGCCDRIQVRSRSAGGGLGPVQTISDPGQEAGDPDIAVGPAGNAVAVWTRFDGTNATCCTRAQARAISAAGDVGPVQVLSAAGQSASAPKVALDGGGNAVMIWARLEPATPGCCDRIQVRTRSVAGDLSPVQTLSAAGQEADDPNLGVDAGGDAVITWARSDGSGFGCCDRIQARSRSASGGLGTVQTLSAGGQNSVAPRVAVDSRGNAAIVWSRFDGTSPGVPGCCQRIQARFRSAAGVLGPVETLSAGGQNALDPQVAVDPNGGIDTSSADTVVVWPRFNGASANCCSVIETASHGALAPPG